MNNTIVRSDKNLLEPKSKEEIEDLLIPIFEQFRKDNPFKVVVINFIDSSNPKDAKTNIRVTLDSGIKTPENSEDWALVLEKIVQALKAPTVEDNELI